jgi:hypothetical protein
MLWGGRSPPGSKGCLNIYVEALAAEYKQIDQAPCETRSALSPPDFARWLLNLNRNSDHIHKLAACSRVVCGQSNAAELGRGAPTD